MQRAKEISIAVIKAFCSFGKNIKNLICENRVAVRAISATCLFVASIVACIVMSGLTFGVEFYYGGERVGVIKSDKVLNNAKVSAVSQINGANVKNFDFKKIELKPVLTVKSRFCCEKELTDMFINTCNDIVYATEIIVNGESVGCINNFDVETYLETCLSRYDIVGAENTHEFVDNIEIKKGYYLASNMSSVQETVNILEGLDVKTTSVMTKEIVVPFSSITQKTSMQYVGYSSVITSGVKGLNRKVEKTESLNGVEVSTDVLSNTVVTAPVNEVVLIGTKSRYSAAAAGSGFIFPVPSGSYTITSYYGDGRNHQGVDLAADKGTSIYAVKSGTVVFSGSNGNYGYCVIVDHGNGLKTLYAHANKLLVSSGEKVAAGQVIATVGTTGRSSGNHLHFEVIQNGANVDPAPYINLK